MKICNLLSISIYFPNTVRLYSGCNVCRRNIRLTCKTAPEGLGTDRAKVSESEQHEPCQRFYQVEAIVRRFIYFFEIYKIQLSDICLRNSCFVLTF